MDKRKQIYLIMKNQVLNIEQMQELINIGINVSNASCCWCKVKATNKEGFDWMLLPEHLDKCDEEHVPTFTFQDIMDMLPKYIKVDEYEYKWNIMPFGNRYVFLYIDTDGINPAYVTFIDENFMIGAYKLLKWCKENKFM